MSLVDSLGEKCRLAQLRINRPVPESELLRFERESGIDIPVDYRGFLLRVANGGTEPCRLLPLSRWWVSYWIDDPKPSMVAESCIVTPDAEQHGEHWLDRAGVSNWSARWDNGE